MTSEDYIDVSSSAPGTYEITACSFPVTVLFSRTGYSPVTFPIWKSTYLVSLTCEGKNCFITLVNVYVDLLVYTRIAGTS